MNVHETCLLCLDRVNRDKISKKKKTMVIPLRNQMTKEKEIKILLKKFINIL